MVATLYKKKPTFNIESVNTDYSSDLPPYFLGIKNAIYINPPIEEEENENELERLYNLAEQPREQDEENDYVNDEYSKYKRVTKALAQKTKDDGPLYIVGKKGDNKSEQQNNNQSGTDPTVNKDRTSLRVGGGKGGD